MRNKENVAIPSTSPVLNQSHAAHRGAYSKHINLNQPKFITKAAAQSRYGQAGGATTSAAASLSQGRTAAAGGSGYGTAAITPSNRGVSDSSQEGHCFRLVTQGGGLASTKNGTQASLLATS